jgi:FkbM family methyltransferase
MTRKVAMKSFLDSIARGTRHIALQSKLARMTRRFQHWSGEDQGRLDFYSQFAGPGSLVFDVGANVGNRSKVFIKLGAKVIGVEPQTFCANFLARVFGNEPNFQLVQKALGAAPGESEIMLSKTTTLSTMSKEWVDAVKATNRFEKATWEQTQTVEVETLDRLIAQYGRPDFVKVDVEGFEEQVVLGLSQSVGVLSLETTPEFLSKTFRCIDRCLSIGPCEFQVSYGETMQFKLPDWVSADDIRSELLTMKNGDFGDLYIRFC